MSVRRRDMRDQVVRVKSHRIRGSTVKDPLTIGTLAKEAYTNRMICLFSWATRINFLAKIIKESWVDGWV